MQQTIAYEEAFKRHPDEVRSIVDQIRKSSSKRRFEPAESFKWSYFWAVGVGSSSFADFAREIQTGQTPERKQPSLADRTRVSLQAAWGTFYRYAELKALPPEVQEWIERCEAEAAQPPTMTAEEALKGLVGTPGFTAFFVAPAETGNEKAPRE